MPPEAMDIMTRALPFETRGVNTEQRTITAYASTGDMDRHGTVIPPKAFRKTLKQYMTNPVVVAGHNTWGDASVPPVVARVTEASVDDKGLLVTIQFAQGDIAERWWALYRDGFMRGLSIGFRVMARSRKPREDGTGEYEVYDEVELLEISLVAVPSNRNSLTTKALEEAITRGVESMPREHREFGERVVEWMRAEGAQRETLTERVALLERELANAMERAGDLETRLDEARDTLDAMLTHGSPAQPAPTAKHDPAPQTRSITLI
ncbi:MAG: HK97 family phage prohead protease [Phycisphaeraceae bacterium]|nr:HK97 family phage prohead protease [Phycisphaeraceae bacterium]